MENIIEPNIHPILVHFAYALSITAFISYVLASFTPSGKWRETLRPAADWMLAFGALAIIATIAAGFQAYFTVAHDGPSHAAMTTHRNWAVPSGVAILLLALWRRTSRTKPASVIFLTFLAAAALSLSVTAWWGGKIVYGYGLGVKSMPTVTGEGHDHEHAQARAMAMKQQQDRREIMTTVMIMGRRTIADPVKRMSMATLRVPNRELTAQSRQRHLTLTIILRLRKLSLTPIAPH